MVLLLSGSSQITRATIAEKAVERHPSWKHLALEVIEQTTPDNVEEQTFHLQLIERCVQELSRDGLHLLLSLPEKASQHDALVEALAPHCTTVHLGVDTEGRFDFAIDPKSTTVNEVVALLARLMEQSEEGKK